MAEATERTFGRMTTEERVMRRNVIGSFIAIALFVSVSGSRTWAQERTWITITAADTERGAFVPRDMPYTQGGPSVGVYLVDRKDVRMPDGQAHGF